MEDYYVFESCTNFKWRSYIWKPFWDRFLNCKRIRRQFKCIQDSYKNKIRQYDSCYEPRPPRLTLKRTVRFGMALHERLIILSRTTPTNDNHGGYCARVYFSNQQFLLKIGTTGLVPKSSRAWFKFVGTRTNAILKTSI